MFFFSFVHASLIVSHSLPKHWCFSHGSFHIVEKEEPFILLTLQLHMRFCTHLIGQHKIKKRTVESVSSNIRMLYLPELPGSVVNVLEVRSIHPRSTCQIRI